MPGHDDPLNILGPGFPERPNHPDMRRLADIVLQHDGLTEDKTFDMDAHLESIADSKSISYLAMQRAFRIVKTLGMNPLENVQLVLSFSAMWVDGFMIAAELRQRELGGCPWCDEAEADTYLAHEGHDDECPFWNIA